jgi:hypothetical protein
MQGQDTARVFDEAWHKDNENRFTYEEKKNVGGSSKKEWFVHQSYLNM